MIVGKGLLARAFEPHFGSDPDVTLFASGVSNSLETNATEFAREESLLRQSLDAKAGRFVYFGSCGVTGDEADLTPYMRHKRAMESLVTSAPGGLVLRLPQVVSRTDNPHTLTNFLRDRIVSGERFTVWAKAERNLIDIDDIVTLGAKLIADQTLDASTIALAAMQSSPMPQIIEIFEQVLGKSANCTYIDTGAPMYIDTTHVGVLSKQLGVDLGDGYTRRIIRKYYATDGISQTSGHRSIAQHTA